MIGVFNVGEIRVIEYDDGFAVKFIFRNKVAYTIHQWRGETPHEVNYQYWNKVIQNDINI